MVFGGVPVRGHGAANLHGCGSAMGAMLRKVFLQLNSYQHAAVVLQETAVSNKGELLT